MAEYINPDYTGGGSDGSLSDPWTSWTDVTFADNETYLQKRGTIADEFVENTALPSRDRIDDITTTMGSYYNVDGSDDETQPKPEIRHYIKNTDSAGWTQPDAGGYPNVWRYDFTQTVNGGRSLLSLGSLNEASMDAIRQVPDFVNGAGGGDHTTALVWANSPSQEGDYQEWTGAVGDPAVIYIYSVGNPITTYTAIYMTLWSYPLWEVRNPVLCTIKNLRFSFSHGLRFVGISSTATTGSVNIYSNEFEFVRIGITISLGNIAYELDGYSIYSNTIRYTLGNGIGITGSVGNHKNGDIYQNNVSYTGQDSSVAGIYIGESSSATQAEPINVFLNEVSYVPHDTLAWPFEGAGIYTDGDSNNINWFKNEVHHCGVAIKDNSGTDNVRWYGNLLRHCDAGIIYSNALANAAPVHRFYDNTLYEVGNDILPHGDAGVSATQYEMIRLGTSVIGTTFNIKNNILLGGDSVNSEGIVVTAAAVSMSATINEGNNCYYDVGTNMTAGTPTDAVEADPLFISTTNYNLQSASSCVGAGVKWWGLDHRPDTLGEPLPDRDIDIGAYQSMHSPLHPTNI